MTDQTINIAPPHREEFVRIVPGTERLGEVQRPLSLWERLRNNNGLRKIFVLLVMVVI